MSAVIKLEHINKQYKMGEQIFKALDDVNVVINENEYVAIIGPSGSGKSTLMNSSNSSEDIKSNTGFS